MVSYLVLARKWRPKQFDDVVGQGPITQTLGNSILSGRIGHAYLFSGPRGVGKTTTARILAKALNCQNGPTPQPCDVCSLCEEINKGSSVDVIEIDGASNNSVDDIRDLREKVHYIPSRARYKVYIIDEVHMLSTQAFNALLKTLEEPPNHIVFILATTEVHKIPLTILSRCQRYDFRRIPAPQIREYLDKLLEQESEIKGEREGAVRLIAKCADGSLRDALSLLDQIISLSDGKINIQQILDLMNLVDRHTIEELLLKLLEGDSPGAILCIEKVVDRGHNLKQFVEQILQYIRDIILFKLTSGGEKFLDLSSEDAAQMSKIAIKATQEDLLRYFDLLTKSVERMRFSSQSRLILETTLIKIAELPKLEPIKEIIKRLDLLEENDFRPLSAESQVIGEEEKEAAITKFIPRPSEGVKRARMATQKIPSIDERPTDSLSTKDFLQKEGKGEKILGLNGKQELVTVQESMINSKPEEINIENTPFNNIVDTDTISGLNNNADTSLPDIGVTEDNQYIFDWSKILEEVKGESMAFGSVLEHFNVNYLEDSKILELTLKDNNQFYWKLIEEKKNQAILHAALTRISGKKMEVRLASTPQTIATKVNEKKEKKSQSKDIQKKATDNGNSLNLISKEPIIQIAMEIFSADIIKTLYGKEKDTEKDIEIDSFINGEKEFI